MNETGNDETNTDTEDEKEEESGEYVNMLEELAEEREQQILKLSAGLLRMTNQVSQSESKIKQLTVALEEEEEKLSKIITERNEYKKRFEEFTTKEKVKVPPFRKTLSNEEELYKLREIRQNLLLKLTGIRAKEINTSKDEIEKEIEILKKQLDQQKTTSLFQNQITGAIVGFLVAIVISFAKSYFFH